MAEGDAMGGEGVAELRRVLVPTDFSEAGLTAIPYAYAVTARGGTVHLLHVVEPVTAPNPLYAHYVPGRMPTPGQIPAPPPFYMTDTLNQLLTSISGFLNRAALVGLGLAALLLHRAWAGVGLNRGS